MLLKSISRKLKITFYLRIEQIGERKSMRFSKKMGNFKTVKNQRQDDEDGPN